MEDILIPLGFFAAIVLIVWIGGRGRQIRISKQTETQQQLLSKFQSGHELAEFMETEGGRRYMSQLESSPHGMILGSLSAGIVFLFLGLGFLALMVRESDFLFPGVILLALGIGFIVAAGVSRQLSKKWQLVSYQSSGSEGISL